MTRRTGGSRGQATVELALVLPLVLLILLLVAQAGVVMRDNLMVVHAAREGARAAAVDPTQRTALLAVLGSGNLDPTRVTVTLQVSTTTPRAVTVTVRYRAATDVPLVGAMVGDVGFAESITMRLEAR